MTWPLVSFTIVFFRVFGLQCLQVTPPLGHWSQRLLVTPSHCHQGGKGREMLLSVWTCGLPCTFMRAVSLYVIGSLGCSCSGRTGFRETMG